MTESTGAPERADYPLENWFLLMDPSWQPAAENEDPPASAVVGAWPLEDGVIGKFRPNPAYVPATEDAPADPLDAVFWLAHNGQAEDWQLRLMLRESRFDVVMNGEAPLITKSPDDVLCAVVATAQPHRARIRSSQWRRVDLDELIELLADEVDVLFNPGATVSLRLSGDFLRETALLGADEIDVADAGEGSTAARFVPWEPGVGS